MQDISSRGGTWIYFSRAMYDHSDWWTKGEFTSSGPQHAKNAGCNPVIETQEIHTDFSCFGIPKLNTRDRYAERKGTAFSFKKKPALWRHWLPERALLLISPRQGRRFPVEGPSPLGRVPREAIRWRHCAAASLGAALPARVGRGLREAKRSWNLWDWGRRVLLCEEGVERAGVRQPIENSDLNDDRTSSKAYVWGFWEREALRLLLRRAAFTENQADF